MASMRVKVTYSNKRNLPRRPILTARRLPNAVRKG